MKGPDIHACPKCGCSFIWIKSLPDWNERMMYDPMFQCLCMMCGLEGAVMSSPSQAVAMWNNRVFTLSRFLAHINAEQS